MKSNCIAQNFNSAFSSTDSRTPATIEMAIPCTVSRRRYKNQPEIAAEQTLKFRMSRSESDKEVQKSLISILVDARILTDHNIELLFSKSLLSLDQMLSIHFPLLMPIIGSLRSLANKLTYGFISQGQAVVAANQIFLSSSCLADALSLVGALATYTVVDFLRECGLDLVQDDEFLQSVSDSKIIVERLMMLSRIDEQTIRVATRMRYLICRRKLSAKQALQTFAYCDLNKVQAESILNQTTTWLLEDSLASHPISLRFEPTQLEINLVTSRSQAGLIEAITEVKPTTAMAA